MMGFGMNCPWGMDVVKEGFRLREMIYKGFYKSPLGVVEIVACDEGIMGIDFLDEPGVIGDNDDNFHVNECLKQIDEYFKGSRKEFDLKLVMNGTDFQKQVWSQLLTIPYGKSASYKDIAIGVGDVKAVRAVGGANGRNKISIVIPCHRVIGASGKLVGYAGGVWRKEWLLKHEGIIK